MIAGIEHIAVCSKDTAALKDWYIKVFGMKQVYDNGKGTYFVASSCKELPKTRISSVNTMATRKTMV